jgi:hypothetical protein
VEKEPKKLIIRMFEFAGLLALSAFLLRLAVCYILEIWPVLVVLAVVTVGVVIGLRVLGNRARW